MEQSITIKAKLLNIDNETAQAFVQSMEKYKDACNFISQYVFDNNFELSQSKLNKALYHEIRDQFGLKSQMAQSAIRNVIARYKTVRTQLSQKPYRFDTGKKTAKVMLFGLKFPVILIGFGNRLNSSVRNLTCNVAVTGLTCLLPSSCL